MEHTIGIYGLLLGYLSYLMFLQTIWYLLLMPPIVKLPLNQILGCEIVFHSTIPYHMARCCACLILNRSRPLVNISVHCSLVAIHLISITVDFMYNLNQFYLILMCFNMGVISGPLLFNNE